MINFTIPGTGSSGHIAGGMLLSAILGPFAGFITMVAVLAIQCLLFADGGLLALGCNIWNMAFYGCFVGALIIWKLVMRNGITKKKILVSSVLGCMITLQMGAFSVVLETYFSGITELPFSIFVATMQPIHLVIGLIEGLITSAVLIFIYEARPELLQTSVKEPEFEETQGKLSYKKTLLILVAAFVVIAGALSLFASTHPDGLEWSIEKITGSTQLSSSGEIHTISEQIQEQTAILPDYSWKDSSSVSGTSFSGIVGGVVVIVVCIVICRILSLVRKRKSNEWN
jgi:cobalt/nickel transport system permease protein